MDAFEPTTDDPELTELDPALRAEAALLLRAEASNFEDRALRDEEAAADAELRDADPLALAAEGPNFEDKELNDEAAAADAELREAAALEPTDTEPELTELAPS